MLISFVCVIYVMRLLQQPPMADQGDTSGGAAVVSLFTGELRPFNWCPPETKKIERPGPGQVLSSAADISKYCEIFIEPTTQEDALIQDYNIVATASSDTLVKSIELNSRGVFRVEGMPFRSKQLLKWVY